MLLAALQPPPGLLRLLPAAVLARLDACRAYIFDEAGVPAELQAKLGSLGCVSCKIFSRSADTAAAFREMLKDDVEDENDDDERTTRFGARPGLRRALRSARAPVAARGPPRSPIPATGSLATCGKVRAQLSRLATGYPTVHAELM